MLELLGKKLAMFFDSFHTLFQEMYREIVYCGNEHRDIQEVEEVDGEMREEQI